MGRSNMSVRPGALTLSETDRRALIPWAADCAERVLFLFEAEASGDPRPRQALEGARAFARGCRKVGELRRLATGAHAAAREVVGEPATKAARACGHAAAVAHMASHALGAAAYGFLALQLGAGEGMAEEYVEWVVAMASWEVRDLLRKLPPRPEGRSGLARIVYELHVRLTAVDDRE